MNQCSVRCVHRRGNDGFRVPCGREIHGCRGDPIWSVKNLNNTYLSRVRKVGVVTESADAVPGRCRGFGRRQCVGPGLGDRDVDRVAAGLVHPTADGALICGCLRGHRARFGGELGQQTEVRVEVVHSLGAHDGVARDGDRGRLFGGRRGTGRSGQRRRRW